MSVLTFVCSGNWARSPMAEALMRARLNYAGVTDLSVCSRGLTGLYAGRSTSENLTAALDREWGIKFAHIATEFRQMDARDAKLVLCMEKSHQSKLYIRLASWETRYNNYDNLKVFTLAQMISSSFDIPDPFPGESLKTQNQPI